MTRRRVNNVGDIDRPWAKTRLTKEQMKRLQQKLAIEKDNVKQLNNQGGDRKMLFTLLEDLWVVEDNPSSNPVLVGGGRPSREQMSDIKEVRRWVLNF